MCLYHALYQHVLQKNDGMGGLSSSDLYQVLVQNSIKSQQKQVRHWPNNWLELTVLDLSVYIE